MTPLQPRRFQKSRSYKASPNEIRECHLTLRTFGALATLWRRSGDALHGDAPGTLPLLWRLSGDAPIALATLWGRSRRSGNAPVALATLWRRSGDTLGTL